MVNAENPRIVTVGTFIPYVGERLATLFDTRAMPQGLEVLPGIRAVAVMGRVDAAFIDRLPDLEIIANFGVGYDGIDADHAARRGVMVTNTPDVLTEEVADTTVALLLNTAREFPAAERYLREGRWVSEGPFPLTRATLRGRRIGIFGMGRIGLAVAKRLEAFGLSIAYHNRNAVDGLAYAYHPTLLSLAEAVDVLIDVAPSTPQTERAVDASVLAALGRDGILVNIGRGSTVDQPALIAALESGTILAAGLDVFDDEPNVPERLLALPNAVLLPHVGSASVATRRAMADLMIDNIESWFRNGRAITPVPETAHLNQRKGRSRDG